MKNRAIIGAALAMALAPMSQGAVAMPRVQGNLGGWSPRSAGWSKPSRRMQRDPSRLQLRGWPETPCDAPAGYFWHRAPQGRRLYYLLKKAPGERIVVYDGVNDRSIIRSGWGYVKPTYAPGDAR